MDSNDAPKPPDAKKTAAQQARYNREAATSQYQINATDQKTPYGSVSYRQTGTWPDGTPKFEATQELSASQQGILDRREGVQTRAGDIATEQIGKLGAVLGTPFDGSNEAAEARIFELGRKRLAPLFAERREGMEANLRNRGILPGGEAYDSERRRFDQGENDAYNQLLLTGRGQAFNEATGERNQNMNEVRGWQGILQGRDPNYVNTPNAGVAPLPGPR